jgi:FemAB-related protein (PEP-CTERM system-associated)
VDAVDQPAKEDVTVSSAETQSFSVHELNAGGIHRWDAFVAGCPAATFFHRAGWYRVIEDSLGHQTLFLYAEDGAGAIVGVLPLVFIRSALFGRSLISTGFCVYGGPAVSHPDAAAALTARAVEIGERVGANHLEYRSRQPRQVGWQCNSSLYVTFRKPIDSDPEKNLLAIPRKQRAMVRKGIAQGLNSEIDPHVERLHAIYAESVKNLGTPVFPKRYFAALQREFGDNCEVLTVTHGNRAVSSVMSFFFRDEVLPYYGGGTLEARNGAGNDWMYWEVMRRAAARGCRIFDFGRSKSGTGSYSFKAHWGFTPEPLHYEYRLLRGTAVPDVNPLNPKFRYFIEAWKRLPLPVANVIGPWIARDLG